ncbi:probable chitinase 10 [Lutzomyia longipalpis]|uniref:probable chitinase 10 n=1 Tax=Lutzomyia longipalpis TaxID=7200 RepID=UPI0024834B28|nr:probable chitinase 10 [Lutzomyia longipalpis]
MKGFTLTLCIVLVVPAVLANIREECESGNLAPGYFPHSQYCNKFYSCVFDTLYEHTCVSPFLWNNNVQNCDYPENVQCGDLVVPQKRSDEPEELPEEDELLPQPAQGCPCAQGCQGADEDPSAVGCGCGCGGGAAAPCPGNCPGGCGCGCGAAQGGCAQAPQVPCPQVPGNNPATCGCGCNIPRPPVPVDLIRKMVQSLEPPRPNCGCQNCGCQNCGCQGSGRQSCGCQSGNNVPRPELTPF